MDNEASGYLFCGILRRSSEYKSDMIPEYQMKRTE